MSCLTGDTLDCFLEHIVILDTVVHNMLEKHGKAPNFTLYVENSLVRALFEGEIIDLSHEAAPFLENPFAKDVLEKAVMTLIEQYPDIVVES